MRGIDIFCASQAATSIRHSMDQASSSSSSSTAELGGRLLDRHNPIIGRSFHLPPCAFQQQQHIDPVPYNLLHQNGRKSSSTAKNDQIKNQKKKKTKTTKKKSESGGGGGGGDKENQSGDVLRKVFGGELITPPGSTRYLLGDKGAFLDVLSDFDSIVSLAPAPAPADDSKLRPFVVKTEEVTEDSVSDSKSQPVVTKTGEEVKDDSVPDSRPPLPPPPSSRSADQVVVLRVSLHCRGCAAKVKKHISRMQGVRSFNIDFAAKKVTVVGDVTPLEVLSSISKVKNAQLWNPGMPPLPFRGGSVAAPTSTDNYSMTNNTKSTIAI